MADITFREACLRLKKKLPVEVKVDIDKDIWGEAKLRQESHKCDYYSITVYRWYTIEIYSVETGYIYRDLIDLVEHRWRVPDEQT